MKSESIYNQTMQSGYNSLMALPGVGISLADALYEKGYYSAEEISKASVEDLLQIRGIDETLAHSLIAAAETAAAQAEIAETAENPSADEPEEAAETAESPPADEPEAAAETAENPPADEPEAAAETAENPPADEPEEARAAEVPAEAEREPADEA